MTKPPTIGGLIILLIASLALARPSNPSARPQSKTEEPQTVPFCQVAKDEDAYLETLIRVKGKWSRSDTFSVLLDPECEAGLNAVVDFDKKNLCDKAKKVLEKVNRELSSEAEVVMVGRLRRCPTGCGHLAFDEYEFVVTCIEDFKSTTKKLRK